MSEESDKVKKDIAEDVTGADAPESEAQPDHENSADAAGAPNSVEPQEDVSADEFDDLFLSPDEDSEGIIEMQSDADFDESQPAGDEDILDADDNSSGVEAELAALQEQVEQGARERDEFKERWMRATADLENLRKRARREKDDFRKYGHDKFAMELIPAVDNLERALSHANKVEDTSGIIDGVEMVYRQVIAALEKHGIVAIDARGQKFDPEHHEAIQQVETTDVDTGTVVEQYQKGYFIHDRLLRPAMVSVAKRTSGGDNNELSEARQPPEGESEQGESGAGE